MPGAWSSTVIFTSHIVKILAAMAWGRVHEAGADVLVT